MTTELNIEILDHLVLTVADPERTARFYAQVLGMEAERFATPTGERMALRFGRQKINLHKAGAEFTPHADKPTPGSADLCFLTDTSLDAAMRRGGH